MTITASLLFAVAGTVCMVIWPLFKGRTAMLLTQFGLTGSFALHYALEHAATAALMNVLSAALIVASMMFGTHPRLRWVGYAFIPVIATVSGLTWNGATSLLSAIGATLNTIGRVQISERALRAVTLAGTPFWLAHDAAIGSPLMIADALSLVMGSIAVFRESRFGATPRRISGHRLQISRRPHLIQAGDRRACG